MRQFFASVFKHDRCCEALHLHRFQSNNDFRSVVVWEMRISIVVRLDLGGGGKQHKKRAGAMFDFTKASGERDRWRVSRWNDKLDLYEGIGRIRARSPALLQVFPKFRIATIRIETLVGDVSRVLPFSMKEGI